MKVQYRIHKNWIIRKSFPLFGSTEVDMICMWNQSSRESSQPNYRPCNEPPAGSLPRRMFMKWLRCACAHPCSCTRLLQMTEILRMQIKFTKSDEILENKCKHTFVLLALWGLWHTDIPQLLTLTPTITTKTLSLTLTLTLTLTSSLAQTQV